MSPRFYAGLRSFGNLRLHEWRWREHRWQLTLGAIFVACALLLFPREQAFRFSDLREGDIYLGEQIIAPLTFSVNKTPEEYERDVQLAREAVYPVFVRRDSVAEHQLATMQKFLEEIERILETLAPDSLNARALQEVFAANKAVISQAGIDLLLNGFKRHNSAAVSGVATLKEYRHELLRIARDIYSIGVLNIERSVLPAYVQKVSLRNGADEMVEPLENLHNLATLNNAVVQKLREIAGLKEPALALGYQILTAFLQPNLIHDPQDTNARIAEAVARVPLARGAVLQNERIIASHEKITAERLQRLKSLEAAKAELKRSSGIWGRIIPEAGRALLVAWSLGMMGLYLFYRRDQLYHQFSRLVLIALILFLVLFLASLAGRFNVSEYLIPLAMVPMLLTVFFDAQVGFVGAVGLGMMLAGLRGPEFSLVFTGMIAGIASILAVRRVRARTWMLKATLYLAVAYLVSALTVAALHYSPWSRVLEDLAFGLLNALICPILTYGVMVILEYVFDVTTDATLLELSDLNRPLLRELALRAPGTYYHSILVGTLSEAAAEAIGANSLLARVGSYYHDLGKIEKPEYFVENQKGGKNPHEKLAPSMSCLVIINHVKRGVEIAESNGLPKELRDFITQHHGTNLVTFFYNKAKERGDDVDEEDSNFRYPGPKPQTKETGIVMLADAVEATTRAFRDPSVSRIRNIVNQIVADRFTSGQLDECPLTLRDLNQIKLSFERTITGIFHGRVPYPVEQKSESNKEKRGDSQPAAMGRDWEEDDAFGDEASAHA
ncbi:MAG: HD family phosphohydrolase [bacterium]